MKAKAWSSEDKLIGTLSEIITFVCRKENENKLQIRRNVCKPYT
jgi:hypothetical protein